MGGADGIDNRQAKELAARTLWLKDFGMGGFKYDPAKRYRTGEIIFVADDYNTPHVGNFYESYSPDGCLGKDPRDSANRPDGWASTYYWLKHGKVFTPSCPGMLETWETTNIPQNRIKALPAPLNASKFWRLALARPDNVNNGQIIFPDDVRGQGLTYWDDTGLVDEAGRQLNELQGDAIRNITGGLATGLIARTFTIGDFLARSCESVLKFGL